MPESNLPSGTADSAPLSFDDGVDAIENLMTDPAEKADPGKTVEATNEAEDVTDEPVEGDEEADEAAADETDEGANDEDGSDEVKGGRFAPDTAKVTLADGTVTTVADLKRNNLFQADYTRKTTELKAERTTVEQQKSQVGQIANSLAKQRDFLLQAAQKFLPTPPDREMMQSDPFGYMQAKADYDERMQVINQLQYQSQAEHGRMTEEQKQAAEQVRLQEAERLMEAVPEFRNRNVYDQFWSDAVTTMAERYGFTAEEMAETTDHRMYLAMRDLVKYRKALKGAPKVAEDIKAKPKMMQGGKRMDPKAKTSREAQQRRDELRKTGSFDAGVRALMDLDL